MSGRSAAATQSSESVARLTLNGRTFDRRTFLGAAGLSAGALLAAQFAPLSFATAATAARPLEEPTDSNGAWHVDDICGHWPRYAHPIPYSPAQALPVSWENVHPADLMFLS